MAFLLQRPEVPNDALRQGCFRRVLALFMKARTLPLLLTAALLAGCGGPTDSSVRADFLREHPTYTVVSLGVGEGDGGACYYHIRYKQPGDSAEHETIWQYLDTGNGPWKLNHKEAVR